MATAVLLYMESCLLGGLCFLGGAHSVFPELQHYLNARMPNGVHFKCQYQWSSSSKELSVFIARELVDPGGPRSEIFLQGFYFLILAKQPLLGEHCWTQHKWVNCDCLGTPPATHTLASISTICRGLGNTDSPEVTNFWVHPGHERLISKHRPDSSLHSRLLSTASLVVPLHCLMSHRDVVGVLYLAGKCVNLFRQRMTLLDVSPRLKARQRKCRHQGRVGRDKHTIPLSQERAASRGVPKGSGLTEETNPSFTSLFLPSKSLQSSPPLASLANLVCPCWGNDPMTWKSDHWVHTLVS